jgi:DNA-binding NtrC family response regulator
MKTRILIAHSDGYLLDLYETVFVDEHCEVEVVENGLQCLASLKEFRPQIMILEWELPWGGGDGVLALLPQQYRRIPVIVAYRQWSSLPMERLSQLSHVTLLQQPLRVHTTRTMVSQLLAQHEHVILDKQSHKRSMLYRPSLHQRSDSQSQMPEVDR